ncbi:ATPase [Trypanosoma theileri]|uniref:ATPase n=1 Tax=Trypanosoma theileri TaxID=67003 RepID=A0A1X0NUY6_9TRYP|nr:ATPase [Trypanosoma theileri]ORC88517.1 ATPase [Trypanosoma theileri]
MVRDTPQEIPQERLGRGCRVPRPARDSYDSLYLAKAMLPVSKRRAESGELQINSRYPERDAAKRALVKMSSTLHSLDEDSMQLFGGLQEEADDNEKCSSVDDGSLAGVASSQLRGKKRNFNRYKVGTHKRSRASSIDSSISNESLRETTHGRGEEGEELLVDHSSSASSSPRCMSENEARVVCKNAKESTVKNVPINHYLDNVIQGVVDSKKTSKRKDQSHRRRMEDVFLGLGEHHGDSQSTDKNNHFQSKEETPVALGDITPLHIDTSVSFEKVGGLPGHIVMLREMVLFPLLYPEVLQAMNLTPPRGVLFVGPPGTGKTLMARALANEGIRCTHRKIAFFMRKGADILSKWVGESERQLSLLFEEAKRQQPSIIFFDEMDGLVPVRHAKSEQSQAALVSTLLALIDGLDDRGQVVVIGATNRPDTIDPALRRPGRFDRELYFPLPDAAARRHILTIVTQPMLPMDHPDRETILEELTARCEGWSGAEIQALCTEAGLNRLRTSLPQIYTTSRKLQIPKNALTIQKEDFFMATHRIKSSVRRGATSIVNTLEEHIEHLLYSTRNQILSYVATVWPSASAALTRERRDCSNAIEAVRELSSFPVPQTAHPSLLFLTPSLTEGNWSIEECEFAIEKISIAILKALPSIRSFTLDLPHLVVDHDNAAVMAASTAMTTNSSSESTKMEECSASQGTNFNTGHIYSCITALQQSSGPSLVLLQGLDMWLKEYGLPTSNTNTNNLTEEEITERQKHMQDLCYYINLLRNSDVLVLVPTLHADVGDVFFGGRCLHTQIRKASCVIPCNPRKDDLHRFLEYVFHVVNLGLSHCVYTGWVDLPDDVSPPPPPSLEQVRAARHNVIDLWRRVEYRRRQLRYILTKWVSQYINSRKFSLFFSADLDFTPGHQLYEEWQQHTHGRRIGLHDVMEKLENEEYTSLSQYHDDIDLLVQNVRSFFRTRSSTDQRYRSRVLELKETTVLNLYKINRNVVQFCEEHKDLAEPDISSSSSSSVASSQESSGKVLGKPGIARNTTINQNTNITRRRPPRRYYGSRRRRRRRVTRPSVASRIEKTEMKKEEEQEQEEEEENVIEEDKDGVNFTETPMDEGKNGDPVISTASMDGINGSSCNGNKSNNIEITPKGNGISEIDFCAEALNTYSFFSLDCVFRAAMPLLEAEISRRLKQQQEENRQEGESTSFLDGTNVEGSASFFQRMIHEAIQATGKEAKIVNPQ